MHPSSTTNGQSPTKAQLRQVKKYLSDADKQVGLPFGDNSLKRVSIRLNAKAYTMAQAVAYYRRIDAAALINTALKEYLSKAKDADDAMNLYRREKAS